MPLAVARDTCHPQPAGEAKIELFYFLAIGWLNRSFAATKDDSRIVAWWGRSDWRRLINLKPKQRADEFAARIKDEFGYATVTPWPIYENQGGGRIMYFMIHATDHPEAPKLMRRAYQRAVDPLEPAEQLRSELQSGDDTPLP